MSRMESVSAVFSILSHSSWKLLGTKAVLDALPRIVFAALGAS